MRLFIAIQLSEEMRDEICRLQQSMVEQGVTGGFVRRENLHLTMAFIGEYWDWERAMNAVESTRFTPFTLELNGLGAFGDLWWAGLERSEPLMKCARALRHRLAEAGIPFDRKRFTPHITILRRAEVKNGVFINTTVSHAQMTVERLSLMRSDRGKNGMIYTELA